MDCIRFWTVIFACGFVLFVLSNPYLVITIPDTEISD